MRTICLLLASLALDAPVFAAEEPSTATLYAGAYGASSGYADRSFAGLFADLHSGNLGIHGDFVGVFREEDAAYGAVGLSYRVTDGVRPKLMIGTSTNNRTILPELLVDGSVEIKPAKGLILTPGLTFRRYRSGGRETAPGLGLARYFDIAADHGGYWVLTAAALVSFNSSTRDGYLFRAGLQTVRKSGFGFGLNAEAGRMTYLSVIGGGAAAPSLAIDTVSGLWSLAPGISYRFGHCELFARAAYIHTRYYDLTSGTTGIKFSF